MTYARAVLAATFALALGAGVAWLDTRPKWDDTGVTAGCLLFAAGVVAVVGVRWWQAALLVACPLVLVEYRSAGLGIVVALAFTTAGAAVGSGLAELARRQSGRRDGPG